MARITSEQAEGEAVVLAAKLMATAARTAPKARGQDSVKTLILDGEDIQQLADAMESKMWEKSLTLPFIERDAANVRRAQAVLLVGVTGEPKNPSNPLNCGACGCGSCAELVARGQENGEDFRGPLCVFQSIDLGIALGSAAKTAAELNVDNRIMYSVGAAARRLGMLDCDVIMGFPLSVGGKNPFFDRAPTPSAADLKARKAM
jgi:uncharacterized ferredoxin-like protein